MPVNALYDAWTAHALYKTLPSVAAFLLVAARLAGLTLLGPVFGHAAIPYRVRALLVVMLTFVVAPLVPQAELSAGVVDYGALALAELALGLALGFGVAIVFSGLHMAGSLIDQQLGFSLGEVFHPASESKGGLGAALLHPLSLFVFLAGGGHLLLISALLDSFQALPVGAATVSPATFDLLSQLVGQSLALAVRVAAPVLAVLTVAGVALGYLGQAIPQVNGLLAGLSLRSLIGLLVLALSMTAAANLAGDAFSETIIQLREALISDP